MNFAIREFDTKSMQEVLKNGDWYLEYTEDDSKLTFSKKGSGKNVVFGDNTIHISHPHSITKTKYIIDGESKLMLIGDTAYKFIWFKTDYIVLELKAK